RYGRYRGYMIAGSILLAAGLGLMGTIDSHTSLVLIGVYLAVLGIGLGMLQQNLVLAVQNTLPVRDIGSGTSLVAFFRTLGGTMGVSVLGAALTLRVTDEMRTGLADLGIDAPGIASGSLPDVHTLSGPVRELVESAYAAGIAEVFLIGVPFALVSVVCVFLLREVPLGARSGIEQRLAEEVRRLDD